MILFSISSFFCSQKKPKPTLIIVLENHIESSGALKSELENKLKIDYKSLKNYSTKIYFLGTRRIKLDYPENVEIKTFLLNDLCAVCDSIAAWDFNDDFSFQVNNAFNPCKTFMALDSLSIDKKLNELRKKDISNLKVLIYRPKTRNSVKLQGIPEKVELSSVVNFTVSASSPADLPAKIGIQIKKEGEWFSLPQRDIRFPKNIKHDYSFDLFEDSKICVEFEKVDGCQVTECSKEISYRYLNKIVPIELITDPAIQDIFTNIYKLDSSKCGAKYEVMPENDKYYFYIKKQKGIDSIQMVLNDLCKLPEDCPEIRLMLKKDPSFDEEKYKGHSRYFISSNPMNPGVVNILTCADLWNYFLNNNEQPSREFEVTFIPQLDKNSEKVKNQDFTKVKLIFKACGK